MSDSIDMPLDLAMAVNSYMRECRSLKVQCLMSEGDISSMITTVSHAVAKVAMISKDQHDSFTHSIYSVTCEDTNGRLHSLQQDSHVLLFSGEGGGFFDIVQRIVKRLGPEVLAPFTESGKIRSILAEFEANTGASLKHKKSVKKRTIGTMPKTSLEWDKTAANREYDAVEDVFKDAEKKNLVIDSLRAFTDGREAMDITVSRKGLITIHSGNVEGIYANVLRPIIDNGLERRNRFSHRSRSERADKEPKPLLIKYKRDVFADDDDMKRFCNLIDEYTHCNYVIVHAGNPHLYISIVDRMDNSTIAVRSVGDDALAIIPQIRTSEASLLRLTEFLASAFYEGVIGEYEW